MPQHLRLTAKRMLLFTVSLILLPLAGRSLIVSAQSPDQKSASANHRVIVSQAGPDDEDTVIDDGDTIEFCPPTTDPHLKFSIIFTPSTFLKLGNGTSYRFDERDCGTPRKIALLDPKDHARAYSYVLAPGDRYFDPHVIIMPGKRHQ
jgi:hypothetical protein